ncbi:MAG: exodeoxyribonuclease V subunit gamma [Methylomonas sp.]
MFILHSSNKTENLLEHLATVIKSSPLSSPFAEEIFLIQSQGMERWLSQQLAEHFQVWGNYRYLFPGKFFSTLTGRLREDLNDTPFDRHLLLWRFEALLRDIDEEVFRPLHRYLSGENIDLKRYQLAQQLARIFDQYQMLRIDLLDTWQQGHHLSESESERWQRALWQRLTLDMGHQHRGECWRQLIARLDRAEPGALAAALPERISIFGVNSAPPLMLSLLQALARHCHVHLYLLNPVQGYWADLPSKHLLAKLETFDGHPLLVRLGQQGREFQQLLLEQVEFAFEPSSFEANEASGILQQLQNDILANETPQFNLKADDCTDAGGRAMQGRQTAPAFAAFSASCTSAIADGSISIHSCHSRLREVQVLKNRLLATLESLPDLELRDIVVMAPDIQLYAPFISAVFADIQHAIADRSLRSSNAALDALLRFLNLSQSRLGWQNVLDLLEQPLVYGNFGLADSDMELIRHWIEDTQVRWGRSAAHKQALGLPPLNQNTWQATLDRLFMGYAIGSDEDFVDDVLPYPDVEGSSSQALGGLNDFLQLLFKAGDDLSISKSLADWQATLIRYADRLLGNADPLERQPLNELLSEIDDIAAIHTLPVALAVMIAWLEGRMDESSSSNGFLRGQLTFCSMLPMRSIPFQVIALMGMNDGEFPKVERSPSFDLLAQNPRLGDRSRRADDRYHFLEILLSARRQLIITYIGQSQQDNSKIPPSVIVSELLDVLRDSYGLADPVIHHPLHAFSPRYFDGSDPHLFNYEQGDHATALRLRGDKADIEPWWQGSIALEEAETISIGDVLQFYNHPQRYFLQQQLGIRLPQLEAEAEEREPFSIDPLIRYGIQQQWIAGILADKIVPLAKFQAQGLWPAGAVGEIEWSRQKPGIEDFASAIQAKAMGLALPALAVDITVGPFRLVGKLGNLYANGSLLYRYANLKGKDFITAWLQHLMINRLQPQATHLLAKDADLVFTPDIATEQALQNMLEIFLKGQQRPDAFFTEAAFCYLKQDKPETALNEVIKQVVDSIENGYEPEIGQLFAHRDLNEIFNDSFAELCNTLLLPAWSAAHAD